MRYRVVLLLPCLLWSMLAATGARAGEGAHWAAPIVANVSGRLDWAFPANLDAPVTPADWNRLVAGALGQPPGQATHEANPTRYWVWTYTGGMARQDRLAREDAVGGLMKLMNVLHRWDLGQDHQAELRRFTDAGQLSSHQAGLVATAAARGWVGGYPDGSLRPLAPLTYGEAAALVERLALTLDSMRAGDPFAGMPGPLGFGNGLQPALSFRPDQVLNGPVHRSGTAGLLLVLHGAAAASALPGVGPAPPGTTWVLLDAQLKNNSDQHALSLARQLQWGLEDPPQLLYRIELHRQATGALASPFGDPAAVLAPGGTVRGLVALAAPVGIKDVWFHLQSALGPAKDPQWPWNGAQRGLIGDLDGPEPVYPHGIRDGSLYRVEGVYPWKQDAAAVVAGARARGIPGWIEAEPDGQYAAVVNFRYFGLEAP